MSAREKTEKRKEKNRKEKKRKGRVRVLGREKPAHRPGILTREPSALTADGRSAAYGFLKR